MSKRIMKKLMLVLCAVFSFTIAANAISFRTTQSLCHGTEQIILTTNGKFELYDDGVEVYSGTYTIDTSTGGNVIKLFVEDRTIRCTFEYKSDHINIKCLTFRGNSYWTCKK